MEMEDRRGQRLHTSRLCPLLGTQPGASLGLGESASHPRWESLWSWHTHGFSVLCFLGLCIHGNSSMNGLFRMSSTTASASDEQLYGSANSLCCWLYSRWESKPSVPSENLSSRLWSPKPNIQVLSYDCIVGNVGPELSKQSTCLLFTLLYCRTHYRPNFPSRINKVI